MKRTLALLLLSLPACEPVRCHGGAAFGLRVFLRDSVTGAAYTDSAVVIAREGAFADTLRANGSGAVDSVWRGAMERPGTYRLDVAAAGYHPWSTTNLRVIEESECRHVITLDVQVRLAPL